MSPLSAVLGRHPKRLWNFSDKAGVSHSVSECPAGVDNEHMMWHSIMVMRYTTQHALILDCTGLVPASLGFWYFCEVVIPAAVRKKDNRECLEAKPLSLKTSKSFSCAGELWTTKRAGNKILFISIILVLYNSIWSFILYNNQILEKLQNIISATVYLNKNEKVFKVIHRLTVWKEYLIWKTYSRKYLPKLRAAIVNYSLA